MVLVGLTAVVLLLLAARVQSQVTIGFVEIDRTVPETSGVAAITLRKTGENTEDIFLRVSPLTFSEYNLRVPGPLPSDFDISDTDPAENLDDVDRVDYNNTPIEHVFPASQEALETIIEVPLVDDQINEATEGFLLLIEVADPIGESVDTIELVREGLALIRISDDDRVELGFNRQVFRVGEDSGTLDELVLVTKGDFVTEQIISILGSTFPFTANNGSDYLSAGSMTLTFLPEQTVLPFPISIVDDDIPENPEAFQVNISLTETTPRVSVSPSATVEIVDDDPITVVFNLTSASVSEGDILATVCLVVSEPPPGTPIADTLVVFGAIQVEGITATSLADYIPPFDTSYILTDIDRETCYSIFILDDSIVEDAEVLRVRFVPEVNLTNVAFPAPVDVTIVDNDLVDECALGIDNCDDNALCIDTTNGFTCQCLPGYQGNGVNCTDIDECSNDTLNDCDPIADCINIPGSFLCTCPPGYTSLGNGTVCTDIDECLLPDICGLLICVNTPGSFDCICPPGLISQPGGSPSTSSCVCPPDLVLGPGMTCQPTEPPTTEPPTTEPPSTDAPTIPGECSDDSECGPNEVCVNNECVCKEGFQLEEDSGTCEDVNECCTPDVCGDDAVCTNTVGSFTCSCQEGFTMQDSLCVPDIVPGVVASVGTGTRRRSHRRGGRRVRHSAPARVRGSTRSITRSGTRSSGVSPTVDRGANPNICSAQQPTDMPTRSRSRARARARVRARARARVRARATRTRQRVRSRAGVRRRSQ